MVSAQDEINRTYGATANYCSVGVLPARQKKPEIRRKSKPESDSPHLNSRAIAAFEFLLARPECHEAIALVMQRMNERTMRKLRLSRRELFEKIELGALSSLPEPPRVCRRPFLLSYVALSCSSIMA